MSNSLSRPLLLLHRGTKARSSDSFRRRRSSRANVDFGHLLDRIHRRLYPETIPVLASYWLKTVYRNQYTRDEWRDLDKLLRTKENDASLPEEGREALSDIRKWIRDSGYPPGKELASSKIAAIARRPPLSAEALIAYTTRLLNEWLPQEIARLLIQEPEPGVSALTVGRALEGLLLRDRLSLSTLEELLTAGLLSARSAYPADIEILRDIVAYLLGRTDAPRPEMLPPVLLGFTPDSRLSAGYAQEVLKGYVLAGAQHDELHVPVTAELVRHVLAEPQARIGSVVVTADGRCWEAANLQEGGGNVIVYHPSTRLRFDYSRDHLRLRVPWPDNRRFWSGAVGFPLIVEIFGRRWKVVSWERDSARTYLNLVFFGALTASAAAGPLAFRRSNPVSADMAWAELGTALAVSAAKNDWDPLDHLQREDLIPLARALFSLTQLLNERRSPAAESIENHLRRVQFLQSGSASQYGLIPWRILPNRARKTLLRAVRDCRPLRDILLEIFSDVPAPTEGVITLRSLVRLASRSNTPFDNYKSA